jgi:hypothetical protein
MDTGICREVTGEKSNGTGPRTEVDGEDALGSNER